MGSIVLVGPRCSGKTSVGRVLSDTLFYPFADADEEFGSLYGRINDFVRENGWEEFRRLESGLVASICGRYRDSPAVFAPGGGAVAHNQGEEYRSRNVRVLREFGTLFYIIPYPDLARSARILDARTIRDNASQHSRPSLSAGSSTNEMLSVLEQRHALYEAAAHHTVYTEEKLPGDVAEDILSIYRQLTHVAE